MRSKYITFLIFFYVLKVQDDLKDMIEERRSMRRLRQDLEKVRLLCELIRKREQRKRDLIVAEKNIMEVKLTPFMYFLKKLLEQLQEIDTSEIFAEPVSLLNVTLIVRGHREGVRLTRSKKSKTPFFQRLEIPSMRLLK